MNGNIDSFYYNVAHIYIIWLLLFLEVKEYKELRLLLYLMLSIFLLIPFASEYNDKSNFKYYIIEGNDWSKMNE
ncbi:hypothetical protein BH753_gp060 [Bacillus phage Shbh1]|uniref:Uncharacterized protein n=1 Tax=Bacillus phage Shbh1 TaxID=1796992 RepID=A0A142F185_9CAUD|nr:hypothetical protein BH753_gp060 [Bacillus phage Shbh1]AMQ66542.1 hypothetical protein [Bacillus phage Shbh1]